MIDKKKSIFQETGSTPKPRRDAAEVIDELEKNNLQGNNIPVVNEEPEIDSKRYIVDDFNESLQELTSDNSYLTDKLNIRPSAGSAEKNNIIKDTESILETSKPGRSGNRDVQSKISTIGILDLSEAEAIADEDILFLTEEDLIEELDDFEILPADNVTDEKKQDALASRINSIPEEAPIPQNKAIKTKIENDDKNIQLSSGFIEEVKTDIDSSVNQNDLETASDFSDSIDNITDKEIFASKVEGTEISELESQNFQFIETDNIQKNILKENVDSKSIKQEVRFVSDLANDLPVDLNDVAKEYNNVIFTDDVPSASNRPDYMIMASDLNRISMELEDTIEGKAYLLPEGDIGYDKDLRSEIYVPTVSFEDLLFDFENIEYKYRDDELDYIDDAIIQDDYSQYIREIDDFYSSEIQKKSSSTAELFRLTTNEFTEIEDLLFASEYKGIDLSEMFDLVKPDMERLPDKLSKKLDVNYILPASGSLIDGEILSIEDDISTRRAIVYEEDIEVIKRLLKKPVDVDNIKNLYASKVYKTTDKPVLKDLPDFDEIQASDQNDIIADITDQIVILEDALDVDRFVKIYPDKKQDELKVLLRYLDGLFEKLPEATIKKFVDSEYFNLYNKILNEIGV